MLTAKTSSSVGTGTAPRVEAAGIGSAPVKQRSQRPQFLIALTSVAGRAASRRMTVTRCAVETVAAGTWTSFRPSLDVPYPAGYAGTVHPRDLGRA